MPLDQILPKTQNSAIYSSSHEVQRINTKVMNTISGINFTLTTIIIIMQMRIVHMIILGGMLEDFSEGIMIKGIGSIPETIINTKTMKGITNITIKETATISIITIERYFLTKPTNA
jgi:hypothetical protein